MGASASSSSPNNPFAEGLGTGGGDPMNASPSSSSSPNRALSLSFFGGIGGADVGAGGGAESNGFFVVDSPNKSPPSSSSPNRALSLSFFGGIGGADVGAGGGAESNGFFVVDSPNKSPPSSSSSPNSPPPPNKSDAPIVETLLPALEGTGGAGG